MAKRPQVPTALHAELTEYSSLLRALRTSTTLDLTPQLTRPPPAFATQGFVADDSSLIADDENAINDPPPTQVASQDAATDVGSSARSLSSGRLHRELSSKGKDRQRDNWSRWPLLAGDVLVPEWGLVDEVQHIAENILRSSHFQDSVDDPEDSDDDPLDEEGVLSALSTPGLHALTADCAALLTRILALLAAHVPAAEKSMQNRVSPMEWETVLDIAYANEAITARTARLVRERMTRLYPPPQPTFALDTRMEHLCTMKAELVDALAKHHDSLLAVRSRPPEVPNWKRGPYKKRKATEAGAGSSSKRGRTEDG